MRTRLQKFLATAGLGSRRGCEELISAGRVRVNEAVATLGATIDPVTDVVTVDGQCVNSQAKEYWLLNKPAGVLSAVTDDRGRRCVTSLVPSTGRVFPVGRLDLDSTGLLLLTNDGELTARLLHPRYHVEKEYVVGIRGRLDRDALTLLRQGVQLEEGTTSSAQVTVLTPAGAGGQGLTELRVVIHEGRKRQVRRMLEAVGHRVVTLHRHRFASLSDAGLPIGQARRLSQAEVADLRRLAGLV